MYSDLPSLIKPRPIRLSTHKVEFDNNQNYICSESMVTTTKYQNLVKSQKHANFQNSIKPIKPQKIMTWVSYYPTGNIKTIYHTLEGKLHHYFKPAISFFRDDINNTLIKECFYEYGKPSDKQEGVFKKIYNI